MTYGELTKEQIDAIVDDPVKMTLLKKNYDAGVAQFQRDVDADIKRLMELDYGTATSTNR